MLVKSIRFAHEITDINNENVDVIVEFENGYNYVIVVGTPGDLVDEMNQEKKNFVLPRGPMIIVRKLTEEIVMEAIQAYAADDGYWLKLYQFADAIDISILNKLEVEHRKELEELQIEEEI